jgi:hypothetical protein
MATPEYSTRWVPGSSTAPATIDGLSERRATARSVASAFGSSRTSSFSQRM